MTQQQQDNLGKTLWKIANELRGAMNADDFRDYMLSFLFLRYLSYEYEEAVKQELGKEYPNLAENDTKTPLLVWYKKNSEEDIRHLEEYLRRKIHYIIKPEYLWNSIVNLAKKQDDNLLKTLGKAFSFIENKSFESSFRGLFSEINLNSEKLGKTYETRNKKLCDIITPIAEELKNTSMNNDELGDAYEYLIAQFAAGSGKKAGEFYTPQAVSDVLSQIVCADYQNPNDVSKVSKSLDKVLDFACGSGSLLLNLRKKMGKNTIGQIYGQEKNITTYNLARMNMLLHKVKDSAFQIHHGDTLENDWDILNDSNPVNKQVFDAIVANPPFSFRWSPSQKMGDDFRFKSYGLAPKSAADFAFLLHGFHYLAEDGTMAIILPHGVLFRGGAELKIRKKLLENNNIEAVIGLPANLFFSTGIPVCILVLKKCKNKDDVLFINASEHFKKVKRQNILEEEHIAKIIDTYKKRPDKVERFARCVFLEEIKENDYNLNISRYVSTAKPEPLIDIQKEHQKLVGLEEQIKQVKAKHNKFLKELVLDTLP